MTRARICVSCLTATTAPGDTFCEPCRSAYDRGALGPNSTGQMSWPAPTATAHDAAGAAVPLHPEQLDLTDDYPCDPDYQRAMTAAAEDGPAELSYFLNLQHGEDD